MSEAAQLASLLEVARQVLRQDVSGGLDPEGRFKAAMIANVMAIAARSLRDGSRLAAEELEALRRLVPDAREAELDRLRRRLTADIRDGRFDGPAERSLRACLRARVDARLAISNPDYRI